ncbi:hypothetical protein ACLUUI_14540 [Enterobacterales bacterium AW_CKDN230030176-1A_HGKHYDSX7]
MIGLHWRLALLALLLGLYAGGRGTWLWQAKNYGLQLASRDQALTTQHLQHVQERERVVAAVLEQVQAQQAKRLDLEQRLQAQDQSHHKELTDAQNERNRLRDRLATTDLRLSVLLDAGVGAAPGDDGRMRAAADAGGMVHGATRAELDPAHAQRIIGITGDGDDGLRALQACQACALEIIQ